MSQLKVNSIIPVAGVPTGCGGGIIQTVQTIKTDTTSSNSASMVDCTGMSVTITPTSSSSKILVTVIANVGTGSGMRTMARILRGSTAIGVGTDVGSRQACGMSSRDQDNGVTETIAQTILDSPNTTSATTYKMQWKVESSHTFYLNRCVWDTDNSGYQRTVSMIMAQEVSA